MLAAAEREARFAYAEALGWLDMAAASSGGAADTDAVNVITARMLDAAGGHDPPRLQRQSGQVGRLAVSDFDLPARV
jgi:hypothetical protein